MTTMAKPITKLITLDRPFDVTSEFLHKKKKPTSVMVIMIPQYHSIKKTKKDIAMEDFYNWDTISMPDDITTVQDFTRFVEDNAK